MDDFNAFRSIYENLDRHRRTAWMVAQRVWSSIVMQGYHSPDAGILRAKPEEIILGAKAYAQDLYERIPIEPLTINEMALAEWRRKADRDDPYRFVRAGQRWLRDGQWEDFGIKVRTELACKYDKRMSRIRLIS